MATNDQLIKEGNFSLYANLNPLLNSFGDKPMFSLLDSNNITQSVKNPYVVDSLGEKPTPTREFSLLDSNNQSVKNPYVDTNQQYFLVENMLKGKKENSVIEVEGEDPPQNVAATEKEPSGPGTEKYINVNVSSKV